MADSLFTFDSTSSSIQRAILTSGSQLFFAYGNIDYPADYSGVDIPDSAPHEKEKSDVVPDMYVASSTNWLATFYDTRFYTFDNVSWTCSDGLVPVLHLEVWDMNTDPEVLLASNTSSASSEWTYQFEKDHKPELSSG